MALVAIGLAAAATGLIVGASRAGAQPGAEDMIPWGAVLVVSVVLYIIAGTFGCFVFAARNPARSNVGRVMSIGDFVSGFMQKIAAWWWV